MQPESLLLQQHHLWHMFLLFLILVVACERQLRCRIGYCTARLCYFVEAFPLSLAALAKSSKPCTGPQEMEISLSTSRQQQ